MHYVSCIIPRTTTILATSTTAAYYNGYCYQITHKKEKNNYNDISILMLLVHTTNTKNTRY